jgi:signal transduction histidine kinase
VRGVWSLEDLHRALWNLVTNAVKYGSPDEPITVRVSQLDGAAHLAVHNVGVPIAPSDQKHIFDAYARTPTADRTGRTGWGLGLTVVRGVAEAHGGQVSLQSDAETGTTFMIELPLDARSARGTVEEQTSANVH